jgi:excisionase family DNA binding protein
MTTNRYDLNNDPDGGPQQLKRAVTRAQAAEELSVSVKTIDRLIGRGQLEAVRIGRCVLVSVASLERICPAPPPAQAAPAAGGHAGGRPQRRERILFAGPARFGHPAAKAAASR